MLVECCDAYQVIIAFVPHIARLRNLRGREVHCDGIEIHFYRSIIRSLTAIIDRTKCHS